MAQPKFVRVDDAGKITTPGVVQQMTDIAKANGVPTGGTTGQVLQRSSTGAATWGNAPSGLPAGGSAGQVVTRQADGTAVWAAGTPGPAGKDGANWSKDQQAKAQGYWIVVSAEEPASATYTTADGTVVPVIWQKPITRTVPVLPQTPAFSRASSSLSVPELVGVVYRITGWSKDNGATWTAITKDLVGGVVTDVKAATGQALPVTVRVEAFAKPGYVLPNAYKWTFDYPDPNATVVVTSDSFTGTDGELHARMSDATLGGTPKKWTAISTTGDTTRAQILGGRLTNGRSTGEVWLEVGAYNQEVEFDVVFPDGVTTWPSDKNIIRIGSNGKWGGGGSLAISSRINVPATSAGAAAYWATPAGAGKAGHYKVSVIGNTARITFPTGEIATYTDLVRTADQIHVSVEMLGGTTPHMYYDNLVVRQVGH